MSPKVRPFYLGRLKLYNDLLLPLDSRNATYSKLVNFLSTSTYYRPDRIFGQLPREGKWNAFICTFLKHSTGMFEVRAILLGRMGKHQAALEIYVYRLNSFAKAEEYVLTPWVSYQTHGSLSGIADWSIKQPLTPKGRSSLFYAFTYDPRHHRRRLVCI